MALSGCRALLEHGASGLALLDLNPSQSKSEIEELRRDFPHAKIITIKVNITDAVDVEKAVKSAASELGRIDALVSYAGIVGVVHALDMAADQWRKIMDVNTTGNFLVAQAVAKQIVAQKTGGSITIIASMSGHHVNAPQPQAAYNTSKAAILHMVHSLAAEWAVYGIRVNSISPGYANTILNWGDGLEEARRAWNKRNPMGRMCEPSELQGPLVLLVSQAGSYITGADLRVDGTFILTLDLHGEIADLLQADIRSFEAFLEIDH